MHRSVGKYFCETSSPYNCGGSQLRGIDSWSRYLSHLLLPGMCRHRLLPSNVQFFAFPTITLAASIILGELSTPWSEPLPWARVFANSASRTPSWPQSQRSCSRFSSALAHLPPHPMSRTTSSFWRSKHCTTFPASLGTNDAEC